MSLLTNRVVVKLGVRAMRRLLGGGDLPAEVSFSDIPARTRVLSVPTRFGSATTTVYEPAKSSADAPPVHVNFHGGGYVVGQYEQDDAFCRYLADAAGVVVVNVDYLLAPEHPFPAAPQEAFDVVRWVAEHGDVQGWDGSMITIGGQSAGGGLAAAVARQAWASPGPRIALQVLHYAPLDLVTDPGLKSAKAKRALISPPVAKIFNAAYVPTPEQAEDPLASPAWEGDDVDLTGIAPALVITPELDRLYDEGVRYATRLRQVEALLAHVDVPGHDHAYNLREGGGEATRKTYRLIAKAIAGVHRPSRSVDG